MDVRAAVAHKAGAALTIETVQLQGPRAGEVLVEIKATGICTPTSSRAPAATRKAFSRRSSGTKAPASWSTWAPASPR